MGRKKTEGDFRQVSFRMPLAHFETLSRYAEARGIDVSAALNIALSDAMPGMQIWLAGARDDFRQGMMSRYLYLLPAARREAVTEWVRRACAGEDIGEELERHSLRTGDARTAADVRALCGMLGQMGLLNPEEKDDGEGEEAPGAGQG